MTSSYQFVCSWEYCGVVAPVLTDIEAHVSAVHLQYVPYVCQICGLRKPNALTAMQHHQDSHAGQTIKITYEGNADKCGQLYESITGCLQMSSETEIKPPQSHKSVTHQQPSTNGAAASPSSSDSLCPSIDERRAQQYTATCTTMAPPLSNGHLTRIRQNGDNKTDDLEEEEEEEDEEPVDALLVEQAIEQDQPMSELPSASNMRAEQLADGSLRFACTKCGKRFLKSSSFWNHWKRHRTLATKSAERSFKCPKCPGSGQFFATKRALACHICVSHKQRFERKCPICDKSFISRAVYNTHCKQLHGLCPYECDVCGKRFHNSGSLRSHEVTHEKNIERTEDRQYLCSICGMYFASQRGLSNHIVRAHGVGSNFEKQCEYCDKTFVSPASYSNHLVQAHEMNIHECAGCQRNFKSARDLKVHQQSYCTEMASVDTSASTHNNTSGQRSLMDQLANDSGTSIANGIESASGISLFDMFNNPNGDAIKREVLEEEASINDDEPAGLPVETNDQQKHDSEQTSLTCQQCQVPVSGTNLFDHILRKHIDQPSVTCPANGCGFSDPSDPLIVLDHITASHASIASQLRPVDTRWRVQSQFSDCLRSLFPEAAGVDFFTEMTNFDSRNEGSAPPVRPKTKLKLASGGPATRQQRTTKCTSNDDCRLCNRPVVPRNRRPHVYMEMFHHNPNHGRYKCTACDRTSSSRGPLLMHHSAAHGQPTEHSILDITAKLTREFRKCYQDCFGIVPPN